MPRFRDPQLEVVENYIHMYNSYQNISPLKGRERLKTRLNMSVSTSRFGPKLNEYEQFYPHEFVGRGSESQLQVGENLNMKTLQV